VKAEVAAIVFVIAGEPIDVGEGVRKKMEIVIMGGEGGQWEDVAGEDEDFGPGKQGLCGEVAPVVEEFKMQIGTIL
jgi:hypothetical protein